MGRPEVEEIELFFILFLDLVSLKITLKTSRNYLGSLLGVSLLTAKL